MGLEPTNSGGSRLQIFNIAQEIRQVHEGSVTMKTLILFRHGKSDWDADFDHDHERPINRRGRDSARTMGRFLERAGQVPERVLSSSAVRARTTVELAAEAGDWTPEIEIEDALYSASVAGLLALLRSLPETDQSVMLVGHEPTFSALSGQLIGNGSVRVPTAAMLRIDLEVDSWPEVGAGLGKLIWAIPPKLFLGDDFDFAE